MTLLEFARSYSMPKELSAIPNCRRKDVVVTIRPYYPPDPDGPCYEQYCHQRLMLHVAFRQMSDLLGEHDTYAAAYAQMLQSTNLPPSLEDDVCRLEQIDSQLLSEDDDTNNEGPSERQLTNQPPSRQVEEWMLVCQHHSNLQPISDPQENIDWTTTSQLYSNLAELPSFISYHRQSFTRSSFTSNAEPGMLQQNQLEVYNYVLQHHEANDPTPIYMVFMWYSRNRKIVFNQLLKAAFTG